MSMLNFDPNRAGRGSSASRTRSLEACQGRAAQGVRARATLHTGPAEEIAMSEKKPVERAEEDLREGKRPSTAAGEFVREEMHHIREGKHGARSTKQAIAIGLSKARRAGVPLKPPGEGQTSRAHPQGRRARLRDRSGPARAPGAVGQGQAGHLEGVEA
jgi:hypothetical protein